jgi:homoserine dehydrogenase
MAESVRLILIGVGNVGRRFLELIVRKQETLRERLGLELLLVGVVDTSGAAVCAEGLDPRQIVDLKAAGRGVAAYPQWGRPGVSPLEAVRNTEADLLLEASPANFDPLAPAGPHPLALAGLWSGGSGADADCGPDGPRRAAAHDAGQPGLACIEAALARGMHVVTANKAPLVLAFPRLLALARERGVQLRFDATVAGGLPAVNLGQRDLAFADIHRLEGVLNLTTNYILTRMADDGLSYDEALAHAQAAGHAETDPTLDVEGWDAANKLVILAHSVLGQPATLADVAVEGIRGVTPEMLAEAAAQGQRLKLVATAKQAGAGYRLSVRPTWLDAAHPLAQLGAKQMGIVYHTDVCGVLSAAIVEETPVPTAAAMLRDVVGIYSNRE